MACRKNCRSVTVELIERSNKLRMSRTELTSQSFKSWLKNGALANICLAFVTFDMSQSFQWLIENHFLKEHSKRVLDIARVPTVQRMIKDE
eukprot:scaffold34605_cov151-Amphora_coffeaeformis.AAC.2